MCRWLTLDGLPEVVHILASRHAWCAYGIWKLRGLRCLRAEMAHVNAAKDQVTAVWVGTPNVVDMKGTNLGKAHVHIGKMSLVAMAANVVC